MSLFKPRYRPKIIDPETGELTGYGEPVESEIWWCRFWFRGRCYRESTSERLKTLAGDYEKRRKREIEECHAKGPAAARDATDWLDTVSATLERYEEAYAANPAHKPKSIAWIGERLPHLKRLLGSLRLMDVKESRVHAYMKQRLEEGAGPRTVNMEVECLSRALGAGSKPPRTWRDLWPDVHKLDEPTDVGRALSDAEEGRLLGAAMKNNSPLIYPFVRLALLTGMRCGEIRTLQLGRIDLKNGLLRIGRENTKTRKGAREIALNAEAVETIRTQAAWLKEKFGEPKPGWYLFPFSRRVKPIDPTRPVTTVKTAWESVRDAAGVKCRLHDLRHTTATKMAENGAPEETMKALLGHMSPEMLEHYSHVRMDAKHKTMEGVTLAKPVFETGKASSKVSQKRGPQRVA